MHNMVRHRKCSSIHGDTSVLRVLHLRSFPLSTVSQFTVWNDLLSEDRNSCTAVSLTFWHDFSSVHSAYQYAQCHCLCASETWRGAL